MNCAYDLLIFNLKLNVWVVKNCESKCKGVSTSFETNKRVVQLAKRFSY